MKAATKPNPNPLPAPLAELVKLLARRAVEDYKAERATKIFQRRPGGFFKGSENES